MEWLFEGLGTLLVGVLLGVAGDRLYIAVRNKTMVRQRQKAGDNAHQVQVGHAQILDQSAGDSTGDK